MKRPTRETRKLIDCDQCIWNTGSWPKKCQRCSEKHLACSQPLHKAEERRAISQASVPTSPALDDTEEQGLGEPSGSPPDEAVDNERSTSDKDSLA